jgi:serine/threonine-protein kinase 24/25/MST4
LFKEFVEKCLNKEPTNRPSARELLKHPFIQKARKTSYLRELIDRYKSWKANRGADNSDSDNEDDEIDADDEDSVPIDWEWGTVRYKMPKATEVVRQASSVSIQNSTPAVAAAVGAAGSRFSQQLNGNSNGNEKPRRESGDNKKNPGPAVPPKNFKRDQQSSQVLSTSAVQPDRDGLRPTVDLTRHQSERRHSPSDVDYRLPLRASIPDKPQSRSLACTVHPLLHEIQEKYRQQTGRAQGFEELRNSFDAADRASPFFTDAFVADLIGSLVGNTLPWNQVENAIQKTKRPDGDYNYNRMT